MLSYASEPLFDALYIAGIKINDPAPMTFFENGQGDIVGVCSLQLSIVTVFDLTIYYSN